ncbi:MAG: 50S ribosomal protein L10 [Ruminococcaceae bacterium]|nr:50S ribosomal protein L10 [Oscillospiraceae bacterium]MBQ4047400.1 50S ribosomal protein L10 [Clostridia bacterium]
MPTNKVLAEKQAVVDALTERLQNAQAGVLCEYKGITVEADTALRRELREAGVTYTVVKNTLLRRAANNCGYGELDSVLHGTTALATSDSDLTAPARIIAEYVKKSKSQFAIKAGILEGKVIDIATVEKLATLPNRETLLSMLLSALTGNLRGLAVAINAIVEKENGGPVESEEAPANE